jgi:hypothetical protein
LNGLFHSTPKISTRVSDCSLFRFGIFAEKHWFSGRLKESERILPLEPLWDDPPNDEPQYLVFTSMGQVFRRIWVFLRMRWLTK